MENIIHLKDLKPDPKNARRHNPRNIGMIENSLRLVGAARSGVVDEDLTILAGNGTAEALAAAGIERVKVVQADGNEWVVVQRNGLTPEQKRVLAVSDNRAAELAVWDGPTLEEQGIDLKPWFSERELASFKEKDAFDFLDDDDAPLSLSPKPASDQARHPLSIVLTNAQKREWDEYKEQCGVSSDTAAFVLLMQERK